MTTTPTALEHARALLAHGLMPIPVPFRSKKAILRGWPKLRLTAADLLRYFNATQSNIGVLLGEPSGWIVDVDLDHPRAVELADSFLPHTGLMWGRKSKPRSHRLYRLTAPAETRKWRLPIGGNEPQMIVEFRSTGCQSIAPGSIHPSGEHVRWDDEGEPATIAPAELQACCEALALAVREEIVGKSVVMQVCGRAGADKPISSANNTPTPTTHDPIVPKDPIDPVDPIDPIDPVRMTPEQVIEALRVTGPCQHDSLTFDLARGLRVNCGIASAQAARWAFDRWWAFSQPFCSAADDPDAAWFKFERAWDIAFIPLGKAGVGATVLVIANQLPDVPGSDRFGPKLRVLVNALAEMGRRARGTPFALSARMVGEAFGVGVATAHEWLKGLEKQGVVRCTHRGNAGANGTGRARRLIYLGCPWA